MSAGARAPTAIVEVVDAPVDTAADRAARPARPRRSGQRRTRRMGTRPCLSRPPSAGGPVLGPLIANSALETPPTPRARSAPAPRGTCTRPAARGRGRFRSRRAGSDHPDGPRPGRADRRDARRDVAPRPARPGGRRRGVRRALRPLRRRRLPVHLLPGERPRARRGLHQRDLPARAAPHRHHQLPGPRHRRLVHHHRPQHRPRPHEVGPAPARDHDRRHHRGHASTRRAPSPPSSTSLQSERLMEAVGQLGDEQRECVMLRFVQGMSVSETAADHGQERRRDQGPAAPRGAQARRPGRR